MSVSSKCGFETEADEILFQSHEHASNLVENAMHERSIYYCVDRLDAFIQILQI